MLPYFAGMERGIDAFELSAEFTSLTFGELAYEIYSKVGAVLMGIYDGEKVQLCPQKTHKHPLVHKQICFVLTKDIEQLSQFMDDAGNPGAWRASLFRARDAQNLRT